MTNQSKQIPVGYKQTDVGTIPEDWELNKLGEICSYINDGTHHTPTYVDSGIPFYSVENVTNDNFKDTKFISLSEHRRLIKRCKPEKGDILLTRIGTLGLTKLIDWDVDASIYVSLALLKLKRKSLTEYVYAYSKSDQFINEILKRSLVNATPQKINMGEIKSVPLCIPSSTKEQSKIAEVLSDIDSLISKLDQLIQKKKNIKQGAMQKLLTGKRRLPGFSGEWEIKSFDDVLRRINAKSHQIQSSEYHNIGLYPVVDQGKKRIVGYSDRKDKLYICPDDGVIVFGDHTCIVKFVDFNFLVGADGTQIMVAKSGQNALFHSYQLEYKGILSTGYNRHFKFVKEREFLAPKLEEQREISEVLLSIDREIEALIGQKNKYQSLKQGTMQQLLTGKIRLI